MGIFAAEFTKITRTDRKSYQIKIDLKFNFENF